LRGDSLRTNANCAECYLLHSSRNDVAVFVGVSMPTNPGNCENSECSWRGRDEGLRIMLWRFPLLAVLPLACLGQSIEFGGLGGVPFGKPFFAASPEATAFGAQSEIRPYTAGGMARVWLPHGFGVEFNALYQRFGFQDNWYAGYFDSYTRVIAHSWEFPLLGMFRFLRRPGFSPYVAIGPAFRATSGNSVTGYDVNYDLPSTVPPILNVFPPGTSYGLLNYRSAHGAAFGLGAEFRIGVLGISPGFRYTRWGADSGQDPSLYSNQNELEVLVGLTVRAHSWQP
jgi:hypothetical protein